MWDRRNGRLRAWGCGGLAGLALAATGAGAHAQASDLTQLAFLPPFIEPAEGAESVLTVRRILEFTQLAGDSNWAVQARHRLAGMVMRLQDAERITVEVPDAREDLYPMHGRYSRREMLVTFTLESHGENISSTLVGEIDLAASPIVASLESFTSSYLQNIRYRWRAELARR